MTTHKEVLEMALKCAERCENIDGMYSWNDTITAIKEALAKLDKIAALQQKTESHDVDCLCSDCAALDDLDEALPQPKQEPVAFLTNRRQRLNVEFNATGLTLMPKSVDWKLPLYTTPPQRTWVGLTLDERLELAQDVDWAVGAYCEYAEKVEAKLKEKNT